MYTSTKLLKEKKKLTGPIYMEKQIKGWLKTIYDFFLSVVKGIVRVNTLVQSEKRVKKLQQDFPIFTLG